MRLIEKRECALSLIKSECKLHPQAQLIDYYKLCFQDVFGPGHIISSKTKAAEFLQKELEIFSESFFPQYQNISCFNDYFRVNISVIMKGKFSFNEYLNMFLRSTEVENKFNWEDWISLWQEIEKMIFAEGLLQSNSKKFSLNDIIEKKYLPSHSEIYKKAYKPHYRLIKARFLNNLLKK